MILCFKRIVIICKAYKVNTAIGRYLISASRYGNLDDLINQQDRNDQKAEDSAYTRTDSINKEEFFEACWHIHKTATQKISGNPAETNKTPCQYWQNEPLRRLISANIRAYNPHIGYQKEHIHTQVKRRLNLLVGHCSRFSA